MGKLTSRGGAVHQDVNWQPFDLPTQTRFIHCGSAPLQSKGGTGLLLKYSKEKVTVKNHPDAPTKFILAFPLLDSPPGTMLADPITLSKPCQLLWDFDEMPHAFVFTIDAGQQVWAESGAIKKDKETAFAFDILFKFALVAEYTRTNKAQASMVK